MRALLRCAVAVIIAQEVRCCRALLDQLLVVFETVESEPVVDCSILGFNFVSASFLAQMEALSVWEHGY